MKIFVYFLNSEIEQLKSRVKENEAAMKFLSNRILYQDVYTRRENLRFFNISESTDTTEENAKELIYRFIERELEVENARDIEFLRVHRIGAKKPDSPQPIIARFLRFPDREKVFKRALELKDKIDVKLYADYPREIQERRGKLWPRLKRAREEGKRAFYWVAYGKPSRGLRLVCLFYFFYFFFRVGKSLACHSPGKWCLCCAWSLLRVFS